VLLLNLHVQRTVNTQTQSSVGLSSEVKRRKGGRKRQGGRRANEALGTDEHLSD